MLNFFVFSKNNWSKLSLIAFKSSQTALWIKLDHLFLQMREMRLREGTCLTQIL